LGQQEQHRRDSVTWGAGYLAAGRSTV